MKSSNLFLLFVLSLSVRLAVRYIASEKVLNSFTYSPVDQWTSVLEGIYLQSLGYSRYHNDLVHQPPLILSLWQLALSYSGDYSILYFVILDLILVFSIVKLCDVSIESICFSENQKKSTTHITSKEMLLSNRNLSQCRGLAILWLCFNPYTILSFASQSTSVVWHIISVWTMIAYIRDNLFLSACLCALGCYVRLYPGYLLIAILAKACAHRSLARVSRIPIVRLTSTIVGFTVTLAVLLYASYIAEQRSWSFLTSVYLHQIRFKDCSPQLGVYWYLFVEMFDHFHELFVWVFQVLLATLVIALGLRFHREPTFLGFVILLVTNVLQPYHSVGEFGYLLALLPLWSHLYKYTRIPLIIVLVLLSSLILTPLLYYLWLQPGTANANFYFAACMVYAVGQILLITDLLNAYVKREFLLRVGPKLELSNGQKLVLSYS